MPITHCTSAYHLIIEGVKLWQQGPASFNITAKTDVCTLPINVPKLIVVYVNILLFKIIKYFHTYGNGKWPTQQTPFFVHCRVVCQT